MDLPQIKTLIADDEPVARKLLREELEIQPEITVIGEAENGRDAPAIRIRWRDDPHIERGWRAGSAELSEVDA